MDVSGETRFTLKGLVQLLLHFLLRFCFSLVDLGIWLFYVFIGGKSFTGKSRHVKLLFSIPLVGWLLNFITTHYFCTATSARPRPLSLWSNAKKNPAAYPTPLPDSMASPPPAPSYGPVNSYTSWRALTDKEFSSRHLPPTAQTPTADLQKVLELFERTDDDALREDRSSVLFAFFAQWFTDSFMRVDPTDRRKNTSNHDIDLCQIYGLNETISNKLRSGTNGKLRSQWIAGEEYMDYLGEVINGEWKQKQIYEGLYLSSVDQILGVFSTDLSRKEKLYATGLERGNSSIGYVAISTLFLREHNRICDQLVKEYGDASAVKNAEWHDVNDSHYFDERVFQTARMINIVLLLKLVVEEYINHVAGRKLFKLNPGFAEELNWYRTNWITIEFDLLYRWHSLIRHKITINKTDYKPDQYRFNNDLFQSLGLAAFVEGASAQKAGRIGLFNTPKFLWNAEAYALKMAREFKLRPYNEYRQRFSLRKLKSIEDLVGTAPEDKALLEKLNALYDGDINKVEYLVGIFAEQRHTPALFGDLMYNMVAYDAFTHIYTNPLLSRNVYGEATFTKVGMGIINSTASLTQLVARNTNNQNVKASFSVP